MACRRRHRDPCGDDVPPRLLHRGGAVPGVRRPLACCRCAGHQHGSVRGASGVAGARPGRCHACCRAGRAGFDAGRSLPGWRGGHRVVGPVACWCLAGRRGDGAGVVHRAQPIVGRCVGARCSHGRHERHATGRSVPPVSRRRPRDRGAISVVLLLLVVVALSGAGLVVDGGRALVARRHASNTAEAAARAAVATATPVSGIDQADAVAAALDYATRAGVPALDVHVTVGVDFVTVTIVERRPTVFLILGGQQTMTVQASGTARVTYTD
ncbi:MAG TPA: hypothetical protein DCQ52_01745 [Acidimicrobiaceae bacterium]|nr:hypothetical protein [Acidimicrobiaceae bacterium]